MACHLIIRLGGHPRDEVTWLLREDQEARAQGQATLASLAGRARGCRVSVLVPGTEVVLIRAPVPAMSRQRLLKAVPYALEEQLAADVEGLHFAIGALQGSGSPMVAVVSRERMDEWLSALELAGIFPELLTPETLAVPQVPDTWSVLLSGGQALVRMGAQDGFAVETQNLASLLALAGEEAGEGQPARIEVYADAQGAQAAALLGELDIPISVHTSEEGVLPWLAAGAGERVHLNLLQGPYGREEKVGRYLRPWRPAAAMLAVWLVVVIALGVSETWRLGRERDTLAGQIEQVYRDAFPEVKRVVNPKVQMERGLADLKKDKGDLEDDFLTLVAGGARELARVDGVELKRMHYRNGRLDLDLTLNDMGVLDPLRQALQGAGNLNASIVSAASRDGVVQGKIRITGKKP